MIILLNKMQIWFDLTVVYDMEVTDIQISSLIFTTNPNNGSATWPWANSILKARKRREMMTLTSAKEKLYPGHFLFPANPKGSKENGGNFALFSSLNRSGLNLFKFQVQTIINLKKLQILCIFFTMDKQAIKDHPFSCTSK